MKVTASVVNQRGTRLVYGEYSFAPVRRSEPDTAVARLVVCASTGPTRRRGRVGRGSAYVGISANGRLGCYRYYACRSRQARGKHACPAERVRADRLEEAVIDALLDAYNNIDLFEQTISEAVAELDNDLPDLAEELVSVEARIRDKTAALHCYLHAFEAGDTSQQVCGPRVDELSQQRGISSTVATNSPRSPRPTRRVYPRPTHSKPPANCYAPLSMTRTGGDQGPAEPVDRQRRDRA